MKRTKRVIASLLALTLTMGSALPAFAEYDPFSDYEVMTDKDRAVSIVNGIAESLKKGTDFASDPSLYSKAPEYDGFIEAVYDLKDDPFEIIEFIEGFKDIRFRYKEYKKSNAVDISQEYINEKMINQASFGMTQEDYEDLTANPDRYELYFIDGEAVLFRDSLVFAIEHKPDIPTQDVFLDVPFAVACEVLKQLDKVFFYANLRNEELQQIEDFMTEQGYWNVVDDEIEIRPSYDTNNIIYNCTSGNDTYKIQKGSGYVFIHDSSPNNRGDANKISIPNTEDSLTLTYGQIETFIFEDGTSIEETELLAKAADHHYSEEPECVWTNNEGSYSAKFVFVCSDCGAKVSYAAEVECEENADGVKSYTAKATVAGKEYTAEFKKTPVAYKAPTISYEAGENSVKLTWTKNDNADLYRVYGYVSGKWQLITESTDTSFVLKSLKAGTEYKVAVVSEIDGKWNMDTSNAVTVKTLDSAQSRYPSVTGTLYNEKYHQFRLSWTKVQGASEYGIAVKQSGKWKVYSYTKDTTFTSPKLKAGSTYEMVICAKIDGKWDTSNLNARAFKVTVK